MAMFHQLDIGVGAVVEKLKQEEVWDNTPRSFLTDQGHPEAMETDNASCAASREASPKAAYPPRGSGGTEEAKKGTDRNATVISRAIGLVPMDGQAGESL